MKASFLMLFFALFTLSAEARSLKCEKLIQFPQYVNGNGEKSALIESMFLSPDKKVAVLATHNNFFLINVKTKKLIGTLENGYAFERPVFVDDSRFYYPQFRRLHYYEIENDSLKLHHKTWVESFDVHRVKNLLAVIEKRKEKTVVTINTFKDFAT